MEERTDLSRIGWDSHAYALVILGALGISDGERKKRGELWSKCERGNGAAAQLSFVYGPNAPLQFDRLKGANWDPTTAARLGKERQSLMLIVSGKKDEFSQFNAFDPSQHRWHLLWFKRLTSKKKQLPDVFTQLIEACGRDDLFKFLDDVSDRPTNAFQKGCLSSKRNPGRLPGRPTYLDPRYGLRTKYDAIKRRYRERKEKITQTAIFEEILRDRVLKDQLATELKANPTPKALMDAFRLARCL